MDREEVQIFAMMIALLAVPVGLICVPAFLLTGKRILRNAGWIFVPTAIVSSLTAIDGRGIPTVIIPSIGALMMLLLYAKRPTGQAQEKASAPDGSERPAGHMINLDAHPNVRRFDPGRWTANPGAYRR